MRNDFVHLHCHSKFSVNDALCSVIDLAKKTKDLGMPAIALTDHGRLGGAVAFSNACYDEGIEGIIGCEIYICDGDMRVKESVMRDGKMRRPKHYHATVLCKNERGYKNLVEISNIGTNIGYYYEPRVDLETIEQHLDGLVVTAGCISGMVPQAILRDEEKRIVELLNWWHSRLGDDFYLEIHKHASSPNDERSQNLHDAQKKIQDRLIIEAEQRGIKIVAANDVHYIRQSDSPAHDILKHLRMKNTENTGAGYPTDQFYLKSAEEMYDLFSEIPEACSNTVEVAEKCEYRFPTKTTWQYPGFDIPESDKFQEWKSKHMPSYTDKQAFLKYLCVGSLRKRGLLDNEEYTERAKYELQKIYEMGVEEYFLILWDVFHYCRKNNIAVGPGRGCLTGDALVLTKDRGYIRLDSLKIDDVVFTHTGSDAKIINKFKYNINEEIISIRVNNGFGDIQLTKDHLVFGKKHTINERYSKFIENGYKSASSIRKYDYSEPDWFPSSELEPNDLLYVPYPHRLTKSFDSIDLSEYTDSDCDVNLNEIIRYDKLTKTEIARHSRQILFDNDFCYFLGRWVGDGWYRYSEEERRYDVGLAFHKDDGIGISTIREYLENLGFTVHRHDSKDKNLTQLIVHNKTFATFIKSLFCEYEGTSSTKYLGDLRYLNNDLLLSLMKGLKDSDGSTEHNKKGDRESIDTTSLRLALEIKEALLYLGIRSSITTRESFHHGDYVCNRSYKLRFKGLDLDKSGYFSDDEGYFTRVIRCDTKWFEGSVYDIQIDNDDHSYLTSNFSVHNSGAGSLVLYLTGITLIDPLDPELDLLFERFLNPGRSSQYKFEFKEYPVTQWKEDGGGEESTGKLRELVDQMMESGQFGKYTPSLIREILPLENQKLDNYYYDMMQKDGLQFDTNPVNSWIAYCLGITAEAPDGPLEVYKMGSLPDVDSDIDHKNRDRVIDYIKNKYGEDHVVNIGTYGEFGAKSTLIGTLKFYGMEHAEAQECSNAIPHGVGVTLKDALESSHFKKTLADHKVPRDAIRNALKIEGSAYSCVSAHAAGVVIAPEPLTDKIPMHRAKDYIVTQFDMGDVETAGYIKYDFLGLSNVGKMARCLENIAKVEGWGNVSNSDFFMAIDRNDSEALDVFRRGQTATIFQFASGGIRQALDKVEVDNFRDLVAIAALYRPGPMAYISRNMYENNIDLVSAEPWRPGITYAENKRNPKTIKYLHSDLEPILKETYGIIVYQEQVMKIAQAIGGFTLQEADILRKAIGKKIGELFEWCHSKFIKGGLERGYDKGLLDEIWKAAENFAKYSFNKSHSTAYALIALWNAYLLAYYPGEWYAASISEDITRKTNKKENKSDVYIKEAQENGIKISQPDVNRSMADAAVDYSESSTTIVLPLSYIKGIGRKSDEIVSYPVRDGMRFESFLDFVVTCNPTKSQFAGLMGVDDIEDLVKGGYSFYSDPKNTGALRSFGVSGADLVADYYEGKRILKGEKKLEKMQENYASCISDLFG